VAVGESKVSTSDPQPDTREGQAGPGWESDRLIPSLRSRTRVPRKRVTTVEGRGLS